jgi:hypothetical protein
MCISWTNKEITITDCVSSTVRTEVLQNGRRVRFSNRTDRWCAFSCSICNQNGQVIGCIQSSSFQGYDGIKKSWEGIIS